MNESQTTLHIQLSKDDIRPARAGVDRSFGGDSAWAPPVPIPNTEVKPRCADGTAGLPLWESRKPPDYPKPLTILVRGFLRYTYCYCRQLPQNSLGFFVWLQPFDSYLGDIVVTAGFLGLAHSDRWISALNQGRLAFWISAKLISF